MQPYGLTVYHPDRVCPGYTLFTPMTETMAYLIDMQGAIVHRWALPGQPLVRPLLAGEGLIVVIGEPAGHQLAGGLRRPGVPMRQRGVRRTREHIHAKHRRHDVKEAVTRLTGPERCRGRSLL